MTVRSRLLPGEVLTADDVHDLCRVKVNPITVDHPIQVGDIFAQQGCWDRKMRVTALHRGRCPQCNRVEDLIEFTFIGHYYATGKIIPPKRARSRELWACRFYGYSRVVTRFKYLFGHRVCS